MIDPKGRTALVAGAGRTVGAGIAAMLGACEAASVAVDDLVADRAETIVAQLRAAGVGAVDTLADNAGISADGAPAVRFRDMPMSATASPPTGCRSGRWTT